MHPFRSLGWGLLVAAFLAAGAESAAQVIANQWGLMAASDVLRVLYPHVFASMQGAVAPFAWEYIVLPVLTLPGWILMGAPGAALAWRYRLESDPVALEDDGEFPHTTYEEIVASAREADEQDIGLPSKYRDLGEYDPSNPPCDVHDEPQLEPYDLERADIVPPARYVAPPFGHGGHGGQIGGGQIGSGEGRR